ncbi:MAG: YihY/virulence factor BrkB family protein [Acidobacteria bacterium]|nr:YihY/virulence factor BrkB family protein [Acidobacteriota bacterium]
MFTRLTLPLSLGELLKRTVNETFADGALDLAAQQAYYFFFALFPAILAVISIASFFPVDHLIDGVVAMLSRVAPGEVTSIVTDQIKKISDTNAGGLLTLAFVFTLWSSSSAVLSMCSTLNTAYDITEGRPWWKVRLTALGLTVGLALFILLSMTLIVAGPTIAEKVAARAGLGPAFVLAWSVLQWPVVFILVATAFALLYYYAPDAEQSWVWITPGSILATVLWLLISLGFKFYVSRFGTYNETYGVIGGVMVLMLWFYLSGIAILVGAEMNAEIEHASPYGKDVGEKVPGEKKKIGALAEKAYEEKRAKGEVTVRPFPDDTNCDIDREMMAPAKDALRPSDVLIGAAVLIPAAVTLLTGFRNAMKSEDEGAS